MFGSSSGGVVGDGDGVGVAEGSAETAPLGAGVFSVRASEGGSLTTATTIPAVTATTTTNPAITPRVLTLTLVTVPRGHKCAAVVGACVLEDVS